LPHPFPGSRRGKHGAAPGVEQRVILEGDDRGDNGIEGAAVRREDVAAGLQRPAQPAW